VWCHRELIREGWLDFVAGCSAGPLFYSLKGQETSDDPTNPARPRFVKTRERLAAFVRDLGVTDESYPRRMPGGTHSKCWRTRRASPKRQATKITGH
jgi:hypothetical protein